MEQRADQTHSSYKAAADGQEETNKLRQWQSRMGLSQIWSCQLRLALTNCLRETPRTKGSLLTSVAEILEMSGAKVRHRLPWPELGHGEARVLGVRMSVGHRAQERRTQQAAWSEVRTPAGQFTKESALGQ